MFIDSTAQYSMGIVPANYDPANPVGTGAFELVSYDVGTNAFTQADGSVP